jgi:tetratricopeptide (TPR) repeat protein
MHDKPARRAAMAAAAGLVLIAGAAAGLSAQSSDALQAYRNGQFQAAIEITQKEIAADGANMDAYAVMCWSLNSLKRHNEAIATAQKGRQVSPSDHRLVEVLAEANYALRNDAAALNYYQQYIGLAVAHEVDNRYIRDAYKQMAEIFIRFTEYHHADISMVAAIQYDRGKTANDPVRASRLWSRLGYIREKAGDVNGSLVAYDKAVSLDAGNEDAISGKGRLKSGSGT